MKTQIIGVLGLGIFGQTIATELSSFGQEVIALDNNATTIDYLADQVTKAAVGDITDIEFLRSAGIDTCDSVIIATGEHLESSALALLQCKKLGIKNIIAKAMNNNYEEVLYGMGSAVRSGLRAGDNPIKRQILWSDVLQLHINWTEQRLGRKPARHFV